MYLYPTKETTMTAPEYRTFLVRLTRHPLTHAERRVMCRDGTLPEDWRSRKAEATDFVKVTATDDVHAITAARGATALTIAGERVDFHETMSNGDYREMTA